MYESIFPFAATHVRELEKYYQKQPYIKMKEKYKMKSISQIEFIQAMTRWRLAQSIGHMKDQADIDQRIYMLTVNLKRNTTSSAVVRDCYETIKHHLNLGRKGEIPQYRLPGLLWSYDASGSRTGGISDLSAHPHLHAILILPTKMGRHNFDVPVRSLEQRLEKVPGVAPWHGASQPVHLKPFVVREEPEAGSSYEQLLKFCSYALKGEALLSQSHQHSPSFATSGVLPRDSFDSEANRNLEEVVERILVNLGAASNRFRHISSPCC